MADTIPEINTRAVLENTPTTPPTTPEAQLANSIRVGLSQSPDTGLALMRGLRQGRNVSEITNTLDQGIGTEIDKTTGKKKRAVGSEEEARFGNASAVVELTEMYKDKGYDGITDTNIQKELRNRVISMLTSWSGANDFFDNFPAGTPRNTAMKEAAERILRDPSLAPLLTQALNEAFDPNKLPPEFNQDLKAKVEQIDKKITAKSSQKTIVSTAKDTASTELDKFKPINGKGRELSKLIREEPTLVRDIKTYNDKVRSLQGDVSIHESARRRAILAKDATAQTDAETAINNLNSEIKNLETDIEAKEKQLARKQQLEDEKKQYEDEKAKKQAELDKIEEELIDLNDEKTRADTELASAKNKRAEQEKNFVAGIEGVFAEATARYIESTLQRANEVQNNILEGLEKSGTDAESQRLARIEKSVLEHLTKQWDTDRPVSILGFRSKVIKEVNRNQVNRDFNNLVSNEPGSGVDEVIDDYLAAADPSLTHAQRIDLIVNKEFKDRIQPQILEALVAKKIQIGQMREGDARRIVESPWGTDLITKAIAKNENAQKQIDALRNQGIISGDFVSWLGKQGGESLLAILIALLGAAAVGVGTVLLNPAMVTGGIAAAAGVGTAAGGRAAQSRFGP